jgi:hypothetical protein
MRVRAIPTLTFADGTGISTYTAFATARFFVAGFVETDRLPSSLSADLFRRIPVAPINFARGMRSSSSSPLVIGVTTVEPTMLLGKGIEETLVDVVEVSIRSFALSLAIVPSTRTQLMLPGKKWTVVYS